MDICVTDKNRLLFVISNRGFHALFIYRISNFLWKKKIQLIPLLLTRIIQILYSIDIDYRCKIEGGVTIVHGVGLVIGKGTVIKKDASYTTELLWEENIALKMMDFLY